MTPMSLSGAERLKEEARGASQKRSDSRRAPRARRWRVEHPPVEVAGLLDLQLVDVTAQAHELPRQLLVLEAASPSARKSEEGRPAPSWEGEPVLQVPTVAQTPAIRPNDRLASSSGSLPGGSDG